MSMLDCELKDCEGKLVLWHDSEDNSWGINKIKSWHPDGGVLELEGRGIIFDSNACGFVDTLMSDQFVDKQKVINWLNRQIELAEQSPNYKISNVEYDRKKQTISSSSFAIVTAWKHMILLLEGKLPDFNDDIKGKTNIDYNNMKQ